MANNGPNSKDPTTAPSGIPVSPAGVLAPPPANGFPLQLATPFTPTRTAQVEAAKKEKEREEGQPKATETSASTPSTKKPKKCCAIV